VKISLLAFLTLLLIPLAARADDPYRINHLSERELLSLYTTTLHDACHHSDKFWTNSSFDPRAGFWGTGRSDNMNEGVRAIGEMVFTSAVMLKYSDVLTPAEREDYSRKAIAALRYVTATHLSGTQKCPDGKPWGGSWQSAMWTGTFGFGAWLMWDKIDPALQKDIERVVGSEADRFLPGKPPAGSFNDTKAEENGWNLICLSLAANLFPDNPHAAAWREKALEYAMNTLSAPQDHDDKSIVDGKPVSEWFVGANVHSDFTLENHGFFHPSYIACSSYFLTQTAMHFTYAHRPVPRAATHHLLDVWRMFRGIMLPPGEAAYPQGMDWELHGLPFINLFGSLATWKQDPFAAHMEKMSIQYMRAWQLDGSGDLAFPGSRLDFTRHAINCEQLSYGFLAHKLFGPAAEETPARDAMSSLVGVRRYNDIQVITHRTEDKFVSMSWTNRLMGMLIPIGGGHHNNPHFTVPMVNGFVGSFDLSPAVKPKDAKPVVLEHSWKETPDGFETTGTLLLNGGRLKQTIKVISIGDKTVVYEDRVTALKDVTIERERGVPLGIENDTITGATRTVSCQDGKTVFDIAHPQSPLAISGSWANVDGRLGLVVVSGNGFSYHQAKDYSPGISVRTDVLYGSFWEPTNRVSDNLPVSKLPLAQELKHFKAGEEVARRIAVCYVETSPEQTATLAKSAKIISTPEGQTLQLKLPEGREAHVALQ
jgi:hypothetical protein